MKKFFSLVLALVMALSLTTVAWGATPVTKTVGTGGDYTSLADAVAAAQDGWTIKLLEDVTVDNMVQLTLAGNVTIDGDGNKLSPSASFTPDYLSALIMLGDLSTTTPANCNYTLKNIVFDGFTAQNVVRISGVTALVSNCKFTDIASDSFMISVKDSDVDVNACVFEGNACAGVVYAADSTGSLDVNGCPFVDNDVTTSTVGGYAVVYTSGSAAVTVTNNTFDGNNVNSTASNGAVIYADEVTATGNTFTDNTVTATGARGGVVVADEGEVSGNVFSGNTQTATSFAATVVSKGDAGTDFDMSGNYWDGTTPDVANAKGNDVTATTYYTTAAGGVLGGLVATNDSSAKTWTGLYGKATTAGAVIAPVAVSYTKAVAPVYSEVDGTVTNTPSIAYYTCLDLSGKALVEVTTLGAADYIIYNDADGKVVFKYLTEVDNVEYEGNGVPFANFGKACGQYKDANYDKTATYYTFEKNVYKAVETSATALMVNGKLVPVVAATGAYVEHIASYTYNEKFEVTAVKCGVCGKAATIVPNYLSLPTGVTGYGPINTSMYYYWGATTVSTDKTVTSAATFDAGIAMYVGMSVLAATGSAVVLKKKD